MTLNEFLISQLPYVFYALGMMVAMTTIGMQISYMEIDEGTI